jgi:nuclear pore complex protein Nup160
LAASFYSAHLDESYFTLSNSLGSVYIVKMGNLKGMVTVNSLKTGSYLGRLLGNFGGMLARGAGGGGSDASSTSASGSGGAAAEAAVSLAIHPVGNDTYVFGLCKDHKVRMWSASECCRVILPF